MGQEGVSRRVRKGVRGEGGVWEEGSEGGGLAPERALPFVDIQGSTARAVLWNEGGWREGMGAW